MATSATGIADREGSALSDIKDSFVSRDDKQSR